MNNIQFHLFWGKRQYPGNLHPNFFREQWQFEIAETKSSWSDFHIPRESLLLVKPQCRMHPNRQSQVAYLISLLDEHCSAQFSITEVQQLRNVVCETYGHQSSCLQVIMRCSWMLGMSGCAHSLPWSHLPPSGLGTPRPIPAWMRHSWGQKMDWVRQGDRPMLAGGLQVRISHCPKDSPHTATAGPRKNPMPKFVS